MKICSSGGVWSPRDQPDHEGLNREEIRAVVEEAKRHGNRKVASHAQGSAGITNAVLEGVASVEHGYQIEAPTIETMLTRGTFLVPTLTTATKVPDKAKSPAYAYDKKMRWMQIAQDYLPAAFEAGVRVALGTDCGVAEHGTNLSELALMVKLGMSERDAIVAGTSNAAELLGMSDEIGTLAAGKRANIVVAQGNPLEDIEALADPSRVVLVAKDGQAHKDIRQRADRIAA